MEQLNLNTTCPNCQASLSVDDKYCPSCGQKKFKKLLPSFGQLLSQMFDTILSVDSKIFRTLRDIFVPAKLSLKYLEDKRTDYYNPFRFFFITGILFLAILNFSDFKDGFNEGSSLNLN